MSNKDMNKKVLISLILSVFISLFMTFFISGFIAQREISSQKDEYEAKGVTFGETLAPVGIPFPYSCAGLCVKESLDIKNFLKDVAIFFVPSYILVYFIITMIMRGRVRFVSK